MLRNVWNVFSTASSRGKPIWPVMKNGQNSITEFSRSEWRAQGTKIIKMRDTIVSSQPLNAIQTVFGFQLHHTDHLLWPQANERVGAK